MDISIFVEGSLNAERTRELVQQIRRGPSARRTLLRRARECPSALLLQFHGPGHPSDDQWQFSGCIVFPQNWVCYADLTGAPNLNTTGLSYSSARINFTAAPGAGPRFRTVTLEIPANQFSYTQVVEFSGVGVPILNSFVEGLLYPYP